MFSLIRWKKWYKEHESMIKEYKAAFLSIWSNPLTKLAFILILMLVIMAVFAPYLSPYPLQGLGKAYNMAERLNPPSLKHLMGTDVYGRDILSRVIFGSRTALYVSIVVISFAVSVGITTGLLAGYFGGKIDEIIMRITDLFLAFPSLLLALVIAAYLGRSLTNALIAIAVTWWPWYTRIVRNLTLSVKESDFVYAARSLGLDSLTIILYYILPNCMAPILVQATIDMGTVILAEASLAFLGLGSPVGSPDWGVMIYEGSTLVSIDWWYSFFPGLMIFLAILAFNLLGDVLREFLDPKLRARRLIKFVR